MVLALALVAGALVTPAVAAEQCHFTVYGRPRIFDIKPSTMPYVEVNVVTFSLSPATINGNLFQMGGQCTQVIRLSVPEARELVAQLTNWLDLPEEDTLIWNKVSQVPAAADVCPRGRERLP